MQKFIVAILTILLAKNIYAVTPNCAESSYCQSCDPFNPTQCLSCYTWGIESKSKPYDKIWANSESTTCIGSPVIGWKVEGCKINKTGSPYQDNSMTSVTTINHPRCLECDDNAFLTWVEFATDEFCRETAPILTGVICEAIPDCLQTACIYADIDFVYCLRCGNSKIPVYTGMVNGLANTYITSCNGTMDGIINCEYYFWVDGVLKCEICVAGYLATYNQLTCESSTTQLCSRLNSDGSSCNTCWHGYYFSGADCKQLALLVVISVLVLIVLGFFI